MSESYIKTIADILKQLPSSFREDYPKSVPAYIVRKWQFFEERYKGQIGNLKGEFRKRDKRIADLEAALLKADERLREYSVNYEYYECELARSWKEVYDKAQETRAEIKELVESIKE